MRQRRNSWQSLSRDRKLFALGALIGATGLSIALASVPRKSAITDDSAMYQALSEIRVSKESPPNFDRDIQRLSSLEPRYRERLPIAQSARLRGPIDRVMKRQYTPTRAP